MFWYTQFEIMLFASDYRENIGICQMSVCFLNLKKTELLVRWLWISKWILISCKSKVAVYS